MDTDEQLKLKQVITAAHTSRPLRPSGAFAEMLTGRHGERLDDWMASVRADDLPHLHRFVRGLKRD